MIYQRIQYFLKAAEFKSFSQAAANMYISPQALTKQIILLEKYLGGRLFDRSPQGIRLTRLGEQAQEKFGKISSDLDHAVEELKAAAASRKECLNIGIFSALPQENLVTPLLSFLLAAFSSYQISLNLIDLDEGRKLLTEKKIDILLTNTHEEDDWHGYRCLAFSEFEAKIIVSLRHPWAIKNHITVEDMKNAVFLKMKMDTDHYKVPAGESFYENVPCRKIQEVGNFNTMYAFLQQGETFAIFPTTFIVMDSAKIKSFDLPGRGLIFRTALIYNPDNPLPGLDAIIRELTEEFDLTEFEA